MSEKRFNARVVHKHDTEENWLKSSLVPLQGEIICFDIDENYSYERFKIGDGAANVNDLPFTVMQSDWSQSDPMATDYIKNRTHYHDVHEELSTSGAWTLTRDGGTDLFIVAKTGLEVAEFNVGCIYRLECAHESDNNYTILLRAVSSSMIRARILDDSGHVVEQIDPNGSDLVIEIIDGSLSINSCAQDFYLTGESDVKLYCIIEDIHQLDPKYIKDMYYTDDPVETELVPETTLDFTNNSMLENPFTVEFVENQTYLVTWNGVEYECVAYMAEGPNAPSIGNGSIAGIGGGNSEPFFCTAIGGAVLLFAAELGTYTMSIIGMVSEVHKIDQKYLPDNILTVVITGQLEDGTFVASHSSSEIFAAENAGQTVVFYDNEGYKYTSLGAGSMECWFECINIWYEEASASWVCIYEDKTIVFDQDRYIPSTERITAQVGQTIVVEEIDENGMPTAWRAIDRHRFEAVTLTDEVNGYEYILSMRNGKLASICRTDTISVVTMPTKTEYLQGELFDPTGMVVMATRQDRTTYEVDMSKYTVPVLETPFTISYIEAGIASTTTIDLTVTEFDPSVQLVDFNYSVNNDGTYYLTGWKGTLNGVTSTELVVPNSSLIQI